MQALSDVSECLYVTAISQPASKPVRCGSTWRRLLASRAACWPAIERAQNLPASWCRPGTAADSQASRLCASRLRQQAGVGHALQSLSTRLPPNTLHIRHGMALKSARATRFVHGSQPHLLQLVLHEARPGWPTCAVTGCHRLCELQENALCGSGGQGPLAGSQHPLQVRGAQLQYQQLPVCLHGGHFAGWRLRDTWGCICNGWQKGVGLLLGCSAGLGLAAQVHIADGTQTAKTCETRMRGVGWHLGNAAHQAHDAWVHESAQGSGLPSAVVCQSVVCAKVKRCTECTLDGYQAATGVSCCHYLRQEVEVLSMWACCTYTTDGMLSLLLYALQQAPNSRASFLCCACTQSPVSLQSMHSSWLHHLASASQPLSQAAVAPAHPQSHLEQYLSERAAAQVAHVLVAGGHDHACEVIVRKGVMRPRLHDLSSLGVCGISGRWLRRGGHAGSCAMWLGLEGAPSAIGA